MRCAVYVRVSTDRDEQKSSLDNQKNLFYNFIGQQGWELYNFYVDVESGTTDKRDSFKRLIEDAEEQKFDCILAKELSRLARNGELSYKIRRVLQSNKIHLITLDGAINTLEDNTDKFGLYAWLYEEESQRMSRRIKVALEQKARRGEFKGSNPPYGYKVENLQLMPRDDETVEAVKLIYQLYLQGKGMEAIAKELDKRAYPTPATVAGKVNAGQFWHGSSVKLILRNPHYVGDLVQGRSRVRSVIDKTRVIASPDEWIIVPNTHDPIISREDFEAVQRMLESRYVKRPKMKTHLFTNVIYCADCGTSLWYLQNRKGYVCGRHRKHGKNACTSHSIKEEYLKKLIMDDLQQMAKALVNKDSILKDFEANIRKKESEKNKRISQMEKEIDELKNENRKYIKLLAQEIITEDEYRDIVECNRQKINQLESKIIEAKHVCSAQSKNDDLLKQTAKELERILEFNDLDEELLHRLIERIEIKENQEVIITYRFANPLNLAV